jgi:integrase
LIGLKKLMKVAILQEWIEYDPTYGIEPPDTTTDGHLAWPAHICAKFELRWPIGTQARTAYALALWMGNRRSDIALLRWDQLTTRIIASEDGLRRSVEGFAFIQFKGRNRKGTGEIFIPITPMLAESLAPLPRGTETVLTRQDGQPYNYKSLTAMMWHWRKAASIEGKYSLHGLRKALGGMLADAEATGHQSKDVLGHRSMAEVDRYSRSRNRAAGSVTGMEKVVKLVRG